MFKKQKVKEIEVINFGFLGGLLESAYVFFIVVVLNYLGTTMPNQKPGIMTSGLILLLFVFSAGVSGIFIFGYPSYLASQKRYFESLLTTVTSLFTIAIVGLLVFVLLSFI